VEADHLLGQAEAQARGALACLGFGAEPRQGPEGQGHIGGAESGPLVADPDLRAGLLQLRADLQEAAGEDPSAALEEAQAQAEAALRLGANRPIALLLQAQVAETLARRTATLRLLADPQPGRDPDRA
jgi:hypothetical protein